MQFYSYAPYDHTPSQVLSLLFSLSLSLSLSLFVPLVNAGLAIPEKREELVLETA
jgi:hypothetical protein